FPPPSEILRVVYSLFAEGRILNHLEATFTAALAGLVIVVALGIFFGFASACHDALKCNSSCHPRAAVYDLARHRTAFEDCALGNPRCGADILRRLQRYQGCQSASGRPRADAWRRPC